MDDANNPCAEICAGWAVGEGALLAGELLKRSQWKHAWNRRFFVLTTEELIWFRSARCEEVRCSRGRFEGRERRALTIDARLAVSIKDGCLHVVGGGGGSSVIMQAPSEPILEAWRAALAKLARQACVGTRTARLLVRQHAGTLSAAAFELLHAGSRNMRERGLAKCFFTCQHITEGRRGLGRLVRGPRKTEEALLSLTALPADSPLLPEASRDAFGEIMAGLQDAAHPFFLRPIFAEARPSPFQHHPFSAPPSDRTEAPRWHTYMLRPALGRGAPGAQRAHRWSTPTSTTSEPDVCI